MACIWAAAWSDCLVTVACCPAPTDWLAEAPSCSGASLQGCICSAGYIFTYDEVANDATCVPLGPASHLTSTVLVAVVPCLIVVLVGVAVLLYRSRNRLGSYARNWAKTNKPPGGPCWRQVNSNITGWFWWDVQACDICKMALSVVTPQVPCRHDVSHTPAQLGALSIMSADTSTTVCDRQAEASLAHAQLPTVRMHMQALGRWQPWWPLMSRAVPCCGSGITL